MPPSGILITFRSVCPRICLSDGLFWCEMESSLHGLFGLAEKQNGRGDVQTWIDRQRGRNALLIGSRTLLVSDVWRFEWYVERWERLIWTDNICKWHGLKDWRETFSTIDLMKLTEHSSGKTWWTHPALASLHFLFVFSVLMIDSRMTKSAVMPVLCLLQVFRAPCMFTTHCTIWLSTRDSIVSKNQCTRNLSAKFRANKL